MPPHLIPRPRSESPAGSSSRVHWFRVRNSATRVFFAVLVFGLLWAAVARVAWEDYYITYRASKNLAEGHGLVFTPGERVHSFTSPLGVLLPALSYLLTGRTSDDAALWVFRLFSFSALAGAACFIWRIVRVLRPAQPWAAVAVVAWLVTDSKTLTFAAGGMETGVLAFFLCWALWACLAGPRGFVWHLGFAWAGLMWSRPDSCVYVAAFGGGLVLLSRRENGVTVSRWRVAGDLVKAGMICAALYLPWFAWAWHYYGSPVPHTIVAKGLFQEHTLGSLLRTVIESPGALWNGRTSVALTFLPYYGSLPPALDFMRPWLIWPAVAMLALAFLPGVSREARFASWLYVAGHLYLTVVLKFPAPWYVPPVAWLGMLASVLALAEIVERTSAARGPRWMAAAIMALVLGESVVFAGVMARQCRLTTDVVEQPVRRAIGEWLRAHAASEHETVLLEPLGYIGFYSGLKMLDYPGLCSPEMVAARKLSPQRSYPYAWGSLIPMLRPDWLVLRPFERSEVNKNDARLLPSSYDLVKVFDATKPIDALAWVPIPGYLRNDAVFEVYRRKAGAPPARPGILSMPISLRTFTVAEALIPVEDTTTGFSAHAPSRLVLPLPEGATELSGGFGLYDGAYAGPRPNVTDGVDCTISLHLPDGSTRELLRRSLDPAAREADRGLQLFVLPLPASPPGATLELKFSPGPAGNTAFDWSFWRELTFGVRMRRE